MTKLIPVSTLERKRCSINHDGYGACFRCEIFWYWDESKEDFIEQIKQKYGICTECGLICKKHHLVENGCFSEFYNIDDVIF